MKKSKVVFLEYSTASRGQHFMTVIHLEDRKRTIIGRMYRNYDTDSRKMTYMAQDAMGNQVFQDTKDLTSLKKKFIESGKTMAMSIPMAPVSSKQTQTPAHTSNTNNRNNDLKSIRERNKPKTIEKEDPKKSPDETSRIQEKTTPRDPDFDSIEGEEFGQNLRSPFQDEFQIDDESEQFREQTAEYEREMELHGIREQNTDDEREQEMEIDM